MDKDYYPSDLTPIVSFLHEKTLKIIIAALGGTLAYTIDFYYDYDHEIYRSDTMRVPSHDVIAINDTDSTMKVTIGIHDILYEGYDERTHAISIINHLNEAFDHLIDLANYGFKKLEEEILNEIREAEIVIVDRYLLQLRKLSVKASSNWGEMNDVLAKAHIIGIKAKCLLVSFNFDIVDLKEYEPPSDNNREGGTQYRRGKESFEQKKHK
jgi:hypothetical protein